MERNSGLLRESVAGTVPVPYLQEPVPYGSCSIPNISAVLWIRIRSDPKLFAGSGSVMINFGSGSDELQFLVTKIAYNLLRPHWLLKILLCKDKKIHSHTLKISSLKLKLMLQF